MDRTNIIQNTTDKKNPDFDFSSITPDDIEKEVDAIKEEFKPKTISARELLSTQHYRWLYNIRWALAR